jgi:hypothetical protein
MSFAVARSILVFTLLGVIPLSLGIVLRQSWLRWIGVGTVGIAWLLSLIWLMPILWLWIRAPKPDPEAVRLAMEEEIAEHGASPNGGPAKSSGNSETGGGPPSVS